jgi:hypothetical protein
VGRVCKGQRKTTSGLEFQPEVRYSLVLQKHPGFMRLSLRVERLEDLKSRLHVPWHVFFTRFGLFWVMLRRVVDLYACWETVGSAWSAVM